MFRSLLLLSLGFISTPSYAQSSVVTSGPTLPSQCLVNTVYITTTVPTMSVCSAPNTWTTVPFGVPVGQISTISTGTCPTGWTEVSALNGKMLRGTVTASGNVGTSAGADAITPSGTVSTPTFTGNSVTSSAVSAGTPAGTNAATATSGNCATANLAIGTGAATACKATAPNLPVPAETFTGSALATHTHATTATGTVSTPTFAGAAFDNRPAYVNVIFCAKT